MNVHRLLRASRDIFLVALITMALGECVLRVFHHFRPGFVFYDSSYNRFRGRPHSLNFSSQLNAAGFNDVDYIVEKGDACRIIGMGDSFAFGVVPYEYNYLTLLEEALNRDSAPLELINMGIPKLGPNEYLAQLASEGLFLDPDLVLLSFFVGNDFLEGVKKTEKSALDYSYVASALRFIFKIRPHFDGEIFQGRRGYRDDSPTFDPKPFLKIEQWRSSICFQGEAAFRELLETSVDRLEQMARICEARGIEFMVIIIPDEFQVNRELQDEIYDSLGKNREQVVVDFSRPNRLLGERLEDLGVGYLDLLPAFLDSDQAPLYKLRDTHWNIAGNRLAADEIAQFFKQRQWQCR